MWAGPHFGNLAVTLPQNNDSVVLSILLFTLYLYCGRTRTHMGTLFPFCCQALALKRMNLP
jgi:hypothetical protein